MSYTEPEGLYPEYREAFTKKLLTFMQTGESLRIAEPYGTGASKYFRYIALSQTIDSRYFAPNNLTVRYIDLNKTTAKTVDQIIALFAQTLSVEENVRAIESEIEKLLQQFKYLYLIIDQSELLDGNDESVVRYLRALRDQYKYRLGYLFVFEKDVAVDPHQLRYILSIAPVEWDFPLLTEMDSRQAIHDIAEKFGVVVTAAETDRIVDVGGGYGKKIKVILSKIAGGMTIDEAISAQQQEEMSERGIREKLPDTISPSQENHDSLFIAQKALTKNEYLVFQELFTHLGSVVTKDTLADLLSPESDGIGVSNEAIDQVISRLRKALIREKLSFTIENKHGVGYFLS